MTLPIHSNTFSSPRHTTHYLESGEQGSPLVIFIHGWPELSFSWRHQLPIIAARGYHTIAPDMRGYGGSSLYSRHEDYALAEVVLDMLELLEHLQQEQAIWVGTYPVCAHVAHVFHVVHPTFTFTCHFSGSGRRSCSPLSDHVPKTRSLAFTFSSKHSLLPAGTVNPKPRALTAMKAAHIDLLRDSAD